MILFWLLSWFIAGTPAVEPWNTWFVFGLACAVASLAGAHRARSSVFVPIVPGTPAGGGGDDS